MKSAQDNTTEEDQKRYWLEKYCFAKGLKFKEAVNMQGFTIGECEGFPE